MSLPTPRPSWLLAAFPLLCLLAAPALAAGPEMVTDRPDQTESSKVVPSGYVQLETGFTVGREDEGGVRTNSSAIPGTLLRIGLVESVELRAGWAGFVSEEVSVPGPDIDADGVGDTAVGAKFYLWQEDRGMPEAAVLVGFSLPTGDDEVSSDDVDPSIRFAASRTLTDTLSLGINAGVSWESEDSGADESTLSTYVYTASLGIGLTDRLGAFVELFGDIPASADGGPANSLDGGVIYRVRDNVQLDASAGFGLSDAAQDWFLGAGVSVRFPH